MNNPVITISLKKHLADFCRHEFTVKNGAIIINRRHPIGKRITSLISASSIPHKLPTLQNPVDFILPLNRNSDLTAKYLYVDRWAQQQIADYIETEFAMQTKIFFERGYQLKFTQKEIIESFLQHYNIKENALSFEAVKKNDYRNQRRIRKNIANMFLIS